MTLPRAIGWPLFCIGTGIAFMILAHQVGSVLAELCG